MNEHFPSCNGCELTTEQVAPVPASAHVANGGAR